MAMPRFGRVTTFNSQRIRLVELCVFQNVQLDHKALKHSQCILLAIANDIYSLQ